MKKGMILLLLLFVVAGLSYAAPKAEEKWTPLGPPSVADRDFKGDLDIMSHCETLVESCKSAALDGDMTKDDDYSRCLSLCEQAQNACKINREHLSRSNGYHLFCKNSRKQ